MILNLHSSHSHTLSRSFSYLISSQAKKGLRQQLKTVTPWKPFLLFPLFLHTHTPTHLRDHQCSSRVDVSGALSRRAAVLPPAAKQKSTDRRRDATHPLCLFPIQWGLIVHFFVLFCAFFPCTFASLFSLIPFSYCFILDLILSGGGFGGGRGRQQTSFEYSILSNPFPKGDGTSTSVASSENLLLLRTPPPLPIVAIRLPS